MMKVMVSAADVSLFHVAQAQLGDAGMWWKIARINGLSDPNLAWLPSPVLMTMPQAGTGLPELAA